MHKSLELILVFQKGILILLCPRPYFNCRKQHISSLGAVTYCQVAAGMRGRILDCTGDTGEFLCVHRALETVWRLGQVSMAVGSYLGSKGG